MSIERMVNTVEQFISCTMENEMYTCIQRKVKKSELRPFSFVDFLCVAVAFAYLFRHTLRDWLQNLNARTPMIHEGECTEIGFNYVVRSVHFVSFRIDFFVYKIFSVSMRREQKIKLKIKFHRVEKYSIPFKQQQERI